MIHFIAEIRGERTYKHHKFSKNQVKVLENVFKESPFVDYSMKVKLGKEFNVTPRRIRDWFQYRRATLRRKGKMH